LKLVDKLKEEFSFFRGNYLILIISWILMDLASEIPGTYYPDYVIQLGGTPTIIGLISLVSFATLASVQFLGGYVADKYGRRWIISTLTFGVALSYVVYAIAPNWHYILIGATINSICLMYQPALNAMMADSLPPEKRGMGFSIINLIISVSTTPGPIFALLLVKAYGSEMGMRIAYTIVTIMFLGAAIVRLKLKESIQNAEKLNLRDILQSYPKALKEGIEIWRNVSRSTFFLSVSSLIIQFTFAMAMNLFLVYAFYVLQIGGAPNPALPPQLDPALQLARERWGYIMTTLFVSMITLSVPVGKILDKVGRKMPLIISGFLIIPAILLFVYGNYTTCFAAMVLAGFVQLVSFSAFQTLFADLVPQAQRGKVNGSMSFFTNIFMAIGGMIGGLLYDNVSPQLPFLLMPVLGVLSSLLVTFYVKEPKPEERQT